MRSQALPLAARRRLRNVNYNTPFPPEVPHALNPPSGVLIDYWLGAKPAGELTLDVLDSAGATVRHLSSVPALPVPEAARPPEPNFWIAPPFQLPTTVGANRTHWDLRYDAPPAFVHTFEINANPGRTPASPVGALVAPGTYTLKLTVDGRSYATRVTVTNDPRSPATTSDVRAQVALQRALAGAMQTAYDAYQQAAAMRARLDSLVPRDSASPAARAAGAFRARLDSVAGTAPTEEAFSFFRPARLPTDFASLHGRFQEQFMAQENGDLAPTEAMRRAFAVACRDLSNTLARWRELNVVAVPAVNAALSGGGRGPLVAAALPTAARSCERHAAGAGHD